MQAAAVNLATTGVGELAIAPYYTTRDGWQTLINLTNTRDVPIVVKVRFKEALNGRDVLNFNVALAGNDVFTGTLSEAADGSGPVFTATDSADALGRRTCTVPSAIAIPGARTPLSTSAFGPPGSPDDDGGPSGSSPEAVDRLREGSIEFFVLGYAEGSDRGIDGGDFLEIGDAIESRHCGVLDTAFSSATAENQQQHVVNTARQFGEPISALKANLRLLNPARGTEVGIPTTTWANFYNRDDQPNSAPIQPEENTNCSVTIAEYFQLDDEPDSSFCRNLIAAQESPTDLEPTLNSGYPPLAHSWSDERNAPLYGRPKETTYTVITLPPPAWRSVDAVSITIQRQALFSEWSTDSGLGVTTDWIVALPTKAFYVDGGAGTGHQGEQGSANYPALNTRRPGTYLSNYVTEPYPPFQNPFGQTTAGNRSSAASCNDITLSLFDRTKQPAGEIASQVCYSTNVITFNGRTALSPSRPLNVNLAGLSDTAGWMRIELDTFAGAGIGVEHVGGPLQGAISEYRGMPVIGINIKQRNFGDVRRNFASSMEHGYRVNIVLQ